MIDMIFFICSVVLYACTYPRAIHIIIRNVYDVVIPNRTLKYEFTKCDKNSVTFVIVFGVVVFVLGLFVKPQENNYTALILNIFNAYTIWVNWDMRKKIISELK